MNYSNIYIINNSSYIVTCKWMMRLNKSCFPKYLRFNFVHWIQNIIVPKIYTEKSITVFPYKLADYSTYFLIVFIYQLQSLMISTNSVIPFGKRPSCNFHFWEKNFLLFSVFLCTLYKSLQYNNLFFLPLSL